MDTRASVHQAAASISLATSVRFFTPTWAKKGGGTSPLWHLPLWHVPLVAPPLCGQCPFQRHQGQLLLAASNPRNRVHGRTILRWPGGLPWPGGGDDDATRESLRVWSPNTRAVSRRPAVHQASTLYRAADASGTGGHRRELWASQQLGALTAEGWAACEEVNGNALYREFC